MGLPVGIRLGNNREREEEFICLEVFELVCELFQFLQRFAALADHFRDLIDTLEQRSDPGFDLADRQRNECDHGEQV